MKIKSFNQFLLEKDVASLSAKSSIYLNPSQSELVKLRKNGINDVRYIIDGDNKDIYIFDANSGLHIDAFIILKNCNILINPIISESNPKFYSRFLTGVAAIESGEMVFKSSNNLDYLIQSYKKGTSPDSRAGMLKDFFRESINRLITKFSFAEKYIKNCTSYLHEIQNLLKG